MPLSLNKNKAISVITLVTKLERREEKGYPEEHDHLWGNRVKHHHKRELGFGRSPTTRDTVSDQQPRTFHIHYFQECVAAVLPW